MIDFESYGWRVGRWSQMVGNAFVAWLDLPPGLRWLDIGCGGGPLSRAVLEAGAVDQLTGVDPSRSSIAAATKAIADPRAVFRQGSAEALPFERDSYDVAVSGLVLNFIEDLETAMREMARVVVPGGCVAGYLWDFAGEMQVLRRFWDAAIAVDPGARASDHGQLYPLCQPEPLRELFCGSGLEDIEVSAIVVEADFPDFKTYWTAMTAADAAPGGYLRAVSDAERDAIRNRLLATLPIRSDGGFGLTVRAWAARGTVPGQ